MPLPWFESGKHQVSLYVDGAQVMQSRDTLSRLRHLEFRSQAEQPVRSCTGVSQLQYLWLSVNLASLAKVIK